MPILKDSRVLHVSDMASEEGLALEDLLVELLSVKDKWVLYNELLQRIAKLESKILTYTESEFFAVADSALPLSDVERLTRNHVSKLSLFLKKAVNSIKALSSRVSSGVEKFASEKGAREFFRKKLISFIGKMVASITTLLGII